MKECSNPECETEDSSDKEWIVPKDDVAYSLSIKTPEQSDLVVFCSFECAELLKHHR